MSIRVETEAIRSGLVRQRTAYQTIRAHFSPTQNNINRYLADDSLAGLAFTANKAYFRDGHIPALNGFKSVLDAASTANDLHISAVDIHLRPHGLYDQATINANLDWVRGSLFWINVAIIASPLVAWAAGLIQLRNERLDFQREWQNRRDRLNAYIAATGAIHDAVASHLTALERLMLRIEIANPCPQTGTMVLPSMGQVILISELKDDNGNICRDALEEMFARGRDNLSPEELAALVYARKYLFEHGDLEFNLHLIAQFAVMEGHAAAHTVDGQVFFVFHDTFRWGDYHSWEFEGNIVLTEIDGRMSLFIKRPGVNGVAVPFGYFATTDPFNQPFQMLFESGWEDTVFNFFHFRSNNIPPELVGRIGEMQAIAEHYALRGNSNDLGLAILNYLGYFESLSDDAPQTSFSNRELNAIAGRWSGSSGRNNFIREIEAHADMLMDNDLRTNIARWVWTEGPTRDFPVEDFYNAAAIADMSADDDGLNKIMMDWGWRFRVPFSR